MSNERWPDLVTEACHDIARREASYREPGSVRGARWRTVSLAVAMAGLMGTIGLNVIALGRSPDPLTQSEQERDLGWLVLDAVHLIERDREVQGRLPATARADELLVPGVSYSLDGDVYRIVAEAHEARVEYISTESIGEWRLLRGLDAAEGGI